MGAHKFLALAEQVEALAGADRALDAAIHAAVVGPMMNVAVGDHKFITCYPNGQGGGINAPFRFTEHVEDAERALPQDGGYPEWQITRRLPTGYHASVGTGDDGVGCETPALALTAAALRFRAEQVLS